MSGVLAVVAVLLALSPASGEPPDGVAVVFVSQHRLTWDERQLLVDGWSEADNAALQWKLLPYFISSCPHARAACDIGGNLLVHLYCDESVPSGASLHRPFVEARDWRTILEHYSPPSTPAAYGVPPFPTDELGGDAATIRFGPLSALYVAAETTHGIEYSIVASPSGDGIAMVVQSMGRMMVWLHPSPIGLEVDDSVAHFQGRLRADPRPWNRALSGHLDEKDKLLLGHWCSSNRILTVMDRELQLWQLDATSASIWSLGGKGLFDEVTGTWTYQATPEDLLGPGTDRPIASVFLDDTPTTVTKYLDRDELLLSSPGGKNVRVRLQENGKPTFQVIRE